MSEEISYEGPHLKICKCSSLLHYHLVDEMDQRICPIPLWTQGMVREAIKKYGTEWNDTVHAHLKGNLADSDLPECFEGVKYQSLDDAIAQWEPFFNKLDEIFMNPPIIFGIETDENGTPTGDGFIAIPLTVRDEKDFSIN